MIDLKSLQGLSDVQLEEQLEGCHIPSLTEVLKAEKARRVEAQAKAMQAIAQEVAREEAKVEFGKSTEKLATKLPDAIKMVGSGIYNVLVRLAPERDDKGVLLGAKWVVEVNHACTVNGKAKGQGKGKGTNEVEVFKDSTSIGKFPSCQKACDSLGLAVNGSNARLVLASNGYYTKQAS
jgi:hypothetical protein